MKTFPTVPQTHMPAHFDDFELAQRFVAEFGDWLRYCEASRTWYAWNGAHWEAGCQNRLELWGQSMLRNLFHQVAAERNEDLRRVLGRYAERAQSRRRLLDMIKTARTYPEVQVAPQAFDANPWRLNLQNGTLDLQSGKLRRHRRGDLIDKCLGISFNVKARCPRWEQFVQEITGGSPDLAAYLQRVTGYLLTGDASEECFFLFYGEGRNGKSTYLEVIRNLLGPYGRTANFDTFLNQREGKVRTDIARLCGARLVTGTETDPGKQLAEALIKQLTGRDTVAARFLYQEEFEYQPRFKIVLAVNHLPVIRGEDHGIWRRMHVVPFGVQFERPDKRLRDDLLRELPGILNWALAGCLEWQREGDLGRPDEVLASIAACREQMLRTGSKQVGAWGLSGRQLVPF